jgi:hypothetical protein
VRIWLSLKSSDTVDNLVVNLSVNSVFVAGQHPSHFWLPNFGVFEYHSNGVAISNDLNAGIEGRRKLSPWGWPGFGRRQHDAFGHASTERSARVAEPSAWVCSVYVILRTKCCARVAESRAWVCSVYVILRTKAVRVVVCAHRVLRRGSARRRRILLVCLRHRRRPSLVECISYAPVQCRVAACGAWPWLSSC